MDVLDIIIIYVYINVDGGECVEKYKECFKLVYKII